MLWTSSDAHETGLIGFQPSPIPIMRSQIVIMDLGGLSRFEPHAFKKGFDPFPNSFALEFRELLCNIYFSVC
jgi:hypothetical protein